MIRVIVGLGSSLGDRLHLLELAAAALAASPGVQLLRASRVYESPPEGGVARHAFLNAAVLLHYDGTPEELLSTCRNVEDRLGRRRLLQWADRTIDLDLLWAEGITCDTPSLELPHPRLSDRSFALRPLLDLEPHAQDPREGQRYEQLCQESPGISTIGVLAPRRISGYPRASSRRHSEEKPGFS